MVSSRQVIYWSPDNRFIAYLETNDENVPQILFSMYNGKQYPEMVDVAYPKAGNINPIVSLHVIDMENDENKYTVVSPLITEDHLFARFTWYGNSKSFLVSWLNRISNQAVMQKCDYDPSSTWSCIKLEDGSEVSTTGWIGNGGRQFPPNDLKDYVTYSYATAFSNGDGYWHAAIVDASTDTKRWITSGNVVVTSVYAHDSTTGWLYFQAAAPEADKRNVYRVNASEEIIHKYPSWECLSCNIDDKRCQWASATFSSDLTYLVINCGGPDVPMSLMFNKTNSEDYGEAVLMENNDHLIENKASVKWPTREMGIYHSDEAGIDFIYEMYKPIDFDPSYQYPLLIEVYGGPGFQKVQSRWTKRWAQTHLVSQYNIIVASVDARGSGYRGDSIAHLMYKKLGQYEKKDTTEMTRFLANFSYIDETRVGIWGWSYGGYTTTHTISEGSGVFKCGLAVAPLASRLYYDSIHTERYMQLPKDNEDGYRKCSILNTDLENFKKASYTVIHGTADDNVHFQNAALLSKALVEAYVDFDNFFYADEAHSINTGFNANQHVYKYLTKKVRSCFNLPKPADMAYDYSAINMSELTMDELYELFYKKNYLRDNRRNFKQKEKPSWELI